MSCTNVSKCACKWTMNGQSKRYWVGEWQSRTSCIYTDKYLKLIHLILLYVSSSFSFGSYFFLPLLFFFSFFLLTPDFVSLFFCHTLLSVVVLYLHLQMLPFIFRWNLQVFVTSINYPPKKTLIIFACFLTNNNIVFTQNFESG